MENSSSESCPTCSSWWRLPLLLAVVLVAIVIFKGIRLRHEANEADTSAGKANGQTADYDPAAAPISLTISFGGGREQVFDDIAWHKGMTVEDVMQSHPRISITRQGAGESSFLTTIGGTKNEGAGGRNWMYSVNGQRADRSFAVYELAPGDHVLWTFTPPQ